MGTPHRGSLYAPWGVIAKNVAIAAGFDASDSILRDLQLDSGILELLREEFGKILREGKFDIYTFQESKGLKGVQGLTGKAVEDVSSGLDGGRERKDYISANHKGMCRFSGHTDPEYCKIRNALQRCQDSAVTRQEQRLAEQNCLNIPECLDCRDSLEMYGTELRFDQVNPAYTDTLHWVFEDMELGLKTWLREGQGLYWIKGKPGSGKSTLMKYIYTNPGTADCLAQGESKKAKAAFFFHDRGSDLQKSFEGLLHGILFQVLQQIPGLIPSILDVYRRAGRGKWTLHSLQNALKAIQQQQILEVDICLFIDALDEYEGKHEEMANFLTDISTTKQSAITKIKVCFSSRALDKFLDHLDPVPGFWMHDQTKEDIRKVVHSRMKENQRMKPYLQSSDKDEQIYADRLSRTICERAQGVFLWVKLVLDDLLDGLTAGDSIEQLDEKLSAMPDGLAELYQRMLTKVDPSYRKESYTMLQIVQCSMRPLSLQEFTEAFFYSIAPSITDRSPCLSPDQYKTEDMKRKIKSRCMGLIELATPGPIGFPADHRLSQSNDTETKILVVQLMHQTVKEYLQKPGLQSIFTDTPTSRDSNGYCVLLKYLLGLAVYWLASKDGPSITYRWLMLLTCYASFAEQTTKESQATLLSDFGEHRMIQLSQFTKLMLYAGTPPLESLLSFAAFAGLPLYLKERIVEQNHVSNPGPPLLHVAMYGYACQNMGRVVYNPVRVVSVLFELGATENELWEGMSAFDEFLAFHLEFMPEVAAVFLDHNQDPNKTIFQRHIRSENQTGCRPLHRAVCFCDISLARVLLKYGAEINALDYKGHSPLDLALKCIRAGGIPVGQTYLQARLKMLQIASFLLDHGGQVGLDHTFLPEIADIKSKRLRYPQGSEEFETLMIDPRLINPPRLSVVVPIEPRVSSVLGADVWLPDLSPSNPGLWDRLLGVFTRGFTVY